MENLLSVIVIILLIILLFLVYMNSKSSRQKNCYRQYYKRYVLPQFIPDEKTDVPNTLWDKVTPTLRGGLEMRPRTTYCNKSLWQSTGSQAKVDDFGRVQTKIASDTITPVKAGVTNKMCECVCATSGSGMMNKTIFESHKF